MNRDIELIHKSIRIWMKKALQMGEHESCPLCQEYCMDDNEPGYQECEECPIKADTGQAHCDGTPFYDVIRWRFTDHIPKHSPERIMASHMAEINYLIGLLPKVEQRPYI